MGAHCSSVFVEVEYSVAYSEHCETSKSVLRNYLTIFVKTLLLICLSTRTMAMNIVLGSLTF